MDNIIKIIANADTKSIKREQINGREHIIMPSYTLPYNVVMNGVLYPESEVRKAVPMINNTLAPLGHPKQNGQDISATSPDAINSNYIGAYNRNARLDEESGRVYVEKVIDVEFANSREGGKELIMRLNQHMNGQSAEPIHTSIAVLATTTNQKGENYNSIANIWGVDHDAILLHEQGAATPDQGVGLLVNSDDAVKPVQLVSDEPEAGLIKRFLAHIKAEKPDTLPKGETMNEEQIKALLGRLNESFGEMMREALSKLKDEEKAKEGQLEQLNNAVNVLAEKVDAVLVANENKELGPMREAVAEHYKMKPETVAAMHTNALKEMHANIGDVPALRTNSSGGGSQEKADPMANLID